MWIIIIIKIKYEKNGRLNESGQFSCAAVMVTQLPGIISEYKIWWTQSFGCGTVQWILDAKMYFYHMRQSSVWNTLNCGKWFQSDKMVRRLWLKVEPSFAVRWSMHLIFQCQLNWICHLPATSEYFRYRRVGFIWIYWSVVIVGGQSQRISIHNFATKQLPPIDWYSSDSEAHSPS